MCILLQHHPPSSRWQPVETGLWHILWVLVFEYSLWHRSSPSPPAHWWPCGACRRGRAASGPLLQVWEEKPTLGWGWGRTKTRTRSRIWDTPEGSCHAGCGRRQGPHLSSEGTRTERRKHVSLSTYWSTQSHWLNIIQSITNVFVFKMNNMILNLNTDCFFYF